MLSSIRKKMIVQQMFNYMKIEKNEKADIKAKKYVIIFLVDAFKEIQILTYT